MARTPAEYEGAKALRDKGLGDRVISRETGIPYGTLRYWRMLRHPPRTLRPRPDGSWRPPNPCAYSYLLGLYLGDGCLGTPSGGSSQLQITLDAAYPAIVREAEEAVRRTVPDAWVGQSACPGAVKLFASDPVWMYALPQHGPGRKHKRKIVLVPWQRAITLRYPKALIRGLIHSDGSRCINQFRVALPTDRIETYAYARYFFTNYSADIRGIFCEHCDLLGIRWTQSSYKNISIAHRDSVAILDSFVGPKS